MQETDILVAIWAFWHVLWMQTDSRGRTDEGSLVVLGSERMFPEMRDENI